MATKKQSSDTLSGEPLRDVSDAAPSDDKTGADAVKAAAEAKDGKGLGEAVQQSALEWFVGSDPIGGADGDVTVVKLNVGSEDSPRWLEWTLRPIELDALRSIRKRAANTREARRTGAVDEFRVNLEVVAAATVSPDLREAARLLHEEGRGPLDPVEVLRQRFHSRPGYITQLAGKVLTASGFDEEDVQDADQVAAAGN